MDVNFGAGGFEQIATSILNQKIEEDIAAGREITNVKFKAIAEREAIEGDDKTILFSVVSKYIARTAYYAYGKDNTYSIFDSVLRNNLKRYISALKPTYIKKEIIDKCDYKKYNDIIAEYLQGKKDVTKMMFDQIVWFSYKKPNSKPRYK